MDYEKAYKEALNRAKLLKYNPKKVLIECENIPVSDYIFPELKESEDERTKEELMQYLWDLHHKDFVPLTPDIPTCNKWLAWLEKQGEQKPADKVKPKFHKGDWIIHHGTENIYQVVARIDNQYQLKYGDNYTVQACADVDRCARLWDITKDAKDGDVLAYVTDEKDLWVMIYESLYEPFEGHVHYHALLVNDKFSDKGICCICIDNLKPATKEQRDTLERAMINAGYRWNKEELKLEKI